MFNSIIHFSLTQRWLMLMLAMVLAALGIYNFNKLPIDAVPDITNIQVQINTEAAGYSPLETEQRITFPIETSMAWLPSLDYTRSLSRYGLSQVTVVFKDGTDIYLARQLINERLNEVKENLPDAINPMMGPIATGLGEIFMYTVSSTKEAGHDAMFLSISPNKIGLYLFDTKNLKNLYREELVIKENIKSLDYSKLIKFLDNNIFKIEKYSGKFV